MRSCGASMLKARALDMSLRAGLGGICLDELLDELRKLCLDEVREASCEQLGEFLQLFGLLRSSEAGVWFSEEWWLEVEGALQFGGAEAVLRDPLGSCLWVLRPV